MKAFTGFSAVFYRSTLPLEYREVRNVFQCLTWAPSNPRHVPSVQASHPTKGTSAPGQEQSSVVTPITVTHCQVTPWTQLVHCCSSSSFAAPPAHQHLSTCMPISTGKLTILLPTASSGSATPQYLPTALIIK